MAYLKAPKIMNLPSEITDLDKYDYYLTVGELRKFLAEHPELTDNSKVLVERISDDYYENLNWEVVYKEAEQYHQLKRYADKGIEAVSDEELQAAKTQYHPVFGYVLYKDDNNLYLDLHY